MTEDRASFWRRNRWVKWVAGGLLVGLAVVAAVLTVLARRAEPFLRARIVEELEHHFQARVELDSFHISLAKGLWAEGKGLRIWPPAQVEGVTIPGPGEPLLRLDEFRFHAPLRYEPGKPIHIQVVALNGLNIKMPPKSHFGHPAPGTAKANSSMVHFDVDRLECTGARLVMGTSEPGKLPLEFAIAHLKLTNIASGGAMGFEAELTNPRPVGTIHSKGMLGPWDTADPGESPIAGDYRFDHADLAIFKGIAGILTSTGHYQGTLRDIVADGEADVPDFRLTQFGTAMPLKTHFHARVDGTNGDTWLEPVDAVLGRSHFTAQGPIVRVPASDAPGAPVHERMTLKGTFTLDEVRFTSARIQDKVEELSLRGQGRPGDLKTTDSATIHSHMDGTFELAKDVMTFPTLQYTVPGADIHLAGTYGVERGVLNFDGTVKLDATASKAVGGWKGFLLKPADRYFQKNGAGTELSIHIEGTRENPEFGIDLGR